MIVGFQGKQGNLLMENTSVINHYSKQSIFFYNIFTISAPFDITIMKMIFHFGLYYQGDNSTVDFVEITKRTGILKLN